MIYSISIVVSKNSTSKCRTFILQICTKLLINTYNTDCKFKITKILYILSKEKEINKMKDSTAFKNDFL